MGKILLTSDTHWGHANILTFKRDDGTPLRPFSSREEMDETMVDNWNKVVGPNDKIYLLGDVGFKNATFFEGIFSRLNGTKVLIKGNHDQLKLSVYMKYFKDIRAVHQLDKIILSHIPIHPESIGRWRGNIHGHTHVNKLSDHRYFNVCVEHTNYTPIDFEEIRCYYKSIGAYEEKK